MLTTEEKERAQAVGKHFDAERAEFDRQRSECARALVANRLDREAANRAIAIDDERCRMLKAHRAGDTSYRFPLIGGGTPAPVAAASPTSDRRFAGNFDARAAAANDRREADELPFGSLS